MQQSRDPSGAHPDVEEVFADTAFTILKERDAAFVVVRPASREIVWANAASAAYWGAPDLEALGRALFGSRSGWLVEIVRGVVPGRPPRLARSGLAQGFRMRARTALIRAWNEPDGVVVVGFAVPESVKTSPVATDLWRQSAWFGGEETGSAGDPAIDPLGEGVTAGETVSDLSTPLLAQRGQLAILRDRLNQAVDGAVSLRLLWRTDAGDAVTQVDTQTLDRLGSTVRLRPGTLPERVADFDLAGAERLRCMLARRITWSGVTIRLPVADAAGTVPMVLSGSPIFAPDRTFGGFRGFGIVDLTGLDLILHHGEAERAGVVGQPGLAVASPKQTVDEPPPPSEPLPPANVVHLRTFHGVMLGRFGGVSVDPSVAVPTVLGEVLGKPDEILPEAEETGGLTSSDALAFQALGDALRARISPAPRPAQPASDRDAPATDPMAGEAGVSPETMPIPENHALRAFPALLDQWPIPLLVIAGRTPVFINTAAAARTGYASAEAAAEAGATLAGPETPAAIAAVETESSPPHPRGTVAPGRRETAVPAERPMLRDRQGRTVALAGRSLPVPWNGSVATLWILDEAEIAGTAAPPVSPAWANDLLDRVDDAVALLDANGRIRRLNRRGEAWFGGLAANGEHDRSFLEMLAPESREAGLSLLGDVRAQRDGTGAPPLKRDVVAHTGDAVPVPMLLTLGRLGGSGFYATLRDATLPKRAETADSGRERDSARLSALLTKLSHRIRTPLGAILGFAEVMMDERFGPLGNTRYRDYLKDIHASGTQVVAMVSDLLDLSRIEAGHLDLDLDVGTVDVNRIIAETVAQMQSEANRGRVIMRTSLAARVPLVLADERSARQIVKNLLSNAVKFNEPGGQVIVSTTAGEAGTVLIRVRDTGVGMTEAEIAAALEPFGAPASTRPIDGNGLGLPLTRALVGVNGASMAIRSRPREGTLVEIAFTSAGAEAARRPA